MRRICPARCRRVPLLHCRGRCCGPCRFSRNYSVGTIGRIRPSAPSSSPDGMSRHSTTRLRVQFLSSIGAIARVCTTTSTVALVLPLELQVAVQWVSVSLAVVTRRGGRPTVSRTQLVSLCTAHDEKGDHICLFAVLLHRHRRGRILALCS
jgi:hypothetical protein